MGFWYCAKLGSNYINTIGTITCGVHQGSILGPLFNICMFTPFNNTIGAFNTTVQMTHTFDKVTTSSYILRISIELSEAVSGRDRRFKNLSN